VAALTDTTLQSAVTRADWILRPILWFVTASTITVVLHEGAHALAAFALGLQPTLYQYYFDWPSESATLAQDVVIHAAGPAFSLVVGLCCFLGYRRMKPSAAGLPLLYLAAFGVAMFFGDLMSAAFTGDFFGLLRWLELPAPARYAISAIGAAGTAAVMFWLGRQLREWIPAKAGKTFGVIGVVVAPIILGTAIIILINQPVPACPPFVSSRLSQAGLGMFTLLGAVRPGASAAGRSFRLWWIDGTIAIVAVLVVRILVFGITL
jgi:hypothetical protein